MTNGFNELSFYPSLAGFSSFVWTTDNKIHLLAGAPKYNSRNVPSQLANGTVLKCTLDVVSVGKKTHLVTDNVEFQNSDCSQILTKDMLETTLYQSQAADATGMSLLVENPEDEHFTVCSPGRQKRCGDGGLYVPGACYDIKKNSNLHYKAKILHGWGEVGCVESFLDVYFVIDASTSIDKGYDPPPGELTNFEKIKNFVKNIADTFASTYGKTTEIGIQRYGTDSGWNMQATYDDILNQPTQHFPIGNTTTIDAFKLNVDNLGKADETDTTTNTALYYVITKGFTESKNYHKSKKLIILVTDGVATDNKLNDLTVQTIRDNNISVFAVGMGDADKRELLKFTLGNEENIVSLSNFDELSKSVKLLTKSIAAMQSEGGTGATKKNTFESAVLGTSSYSPLSTKTKSNDHRSEMLISGIGAYDNTGAITKYSADNSSFYQIPKNFTSISSSSYLGYSSTTGKFQKNSEKFYIVAGAPRDELLGAVYFFETLKGETVRKWKLVAPKKSNGCSFLSCRQVGSYFGGSVTSGDVNGDGVDDVIVGAPLFSTISYEEGRVFLYLSNLNTSHETMMDLWTEKSYQPKVLLGSEAKGGRFGFSTAVAGDLDSDGHVDLLVSAPQAYNGEGAIYLFNGCPDKKEGFKLSQEIRSRSLLGNKPAWLGFTLQAGIDVDKNKHPDVLVTAPRAETAFVLRTRTVLKFETSLELSKNKIDLFSCYKKNSACVKAKFCILYTGKMVEKEIEVDVTFELDKNNTKRVVLARSDSFSSNTLTEEHKLQKDTKMCYTYKIKIKPRIEDLESSVDVLVKYDLAKSHSESLMSAIRSPYSKNLLKRVTKFSHLCGEDKICYYNLVLTASAELQSKAVHDHDEAEEHSEQNKSSSMFLVEKDSKKFLHVKITIKNEHEASQSVKLNAKFLSSLTWVQVTDHREGKLSKCVGKYSRLPNDGNYRQIEIKIENKNFKNVYPHNEECELELMFSLSNILYHSGRINETYLSLNVFGSESEFFNETLKDDNGYKIAIPIRYQSDVKLIKQPLQTVIDLEKVQNITKVIDVSALSEEVLTKFK